MDKELIEKLTSKDNQSACDFTGVILTESYESDKWYNHFDDFVSLLNHPSSFVRNRIIYILAANSKWDIENKFEKIIDEYLSHVTDEKPITARQCVKALGEIGKYKPNLISKIVNKLDTSDLSKYRDSMRPLIQKDIEETKNKLLSFK